MGFSITRLQIPSIYPDSLQGPLEQRNRDAQRDRSKEGEKQHVAPDRSERGLFQQQAFEAIHRIGKGSHLAIARSQGGKA